MSSKDNKGVSPSSYYQRVLQKALDDTLQSLGEQGKAALVRDLHLRSARLPPDEILSIEKINGALSELVGEDFSRLFIEQMLIRMDELYSGKQGRFKPL